MTDDPVAGTRSRSMLAPLREILRQERQRTVPAHTSVLHYLGALAVIFFLVEAATGILLLVYYRPSASAAYYSTGIIMDEVRFGWLVRSLHRWGSDLLILFCFLHLIRVYFSRAYLAPRQLNWIIGVLLLVLVLTLGFTGTLLPWDQYAYWYIDGARKTIAAVPVMGNVVLALIWGGWEIGEEVLLRFYAFHVGVLPWLALAFLLVHVLLVWRLGIKTPATGTGRPAAPTPFLPDFLLSLLVTALLVAGLLVTVAVCFPATLAEPADPLSPLGHAQPRWYLMPLRELLRGLPGGAAATTVAAFLLVVLLVPALDRSVAPPRWLRILQPALGLLVIVAWLALTLRGYSR